MPAYLRFVGWIPDWAGDESFGAPSPNSFAVLQPNARFPRAANFAVAVHFPIWNSQYSCLAFPKGQSHDVSLLLSTRTLVQSPTSPGYPPTFNRPPFAQSPRVRKGLRRLSWDCFHLHPFIEVFLVISFQDPRRGMNRGRRCSVKSRRRRRPCPPLSLLVSSPIPRMSFSYPKFTSHPSVSPSRLLQSGRSPSSSAWWPLPNRVWSATPFPSYHSKVSFVYSVD